MKDIAFFNAGCHRPRGLSRLVMVSVRRALRRVLRPIFFHQFELYRELFDRLYGVELGVEDLRTEVRQLHVARNELKALNNRQDEVNAHLKSTQEQLQTALAFGWDYVALVRRLAVLEDQVAALTGPQATASGDEAEPCSSILFPGLEKMGIGPAEPESQAKVC